MRYDDDVVDIYHVWPLNRNGGAARGEERIRATNFRDLLRILSEMSAVSRLPEDQEHYVKFVNRRTGVTVEQELIRHFHGSNVIALKGQVVLHQTRQGDGVEDQLGVYPDARHAYAALEALPPAYWRTKLTASTTLGPNKIQTYAVTWSPEGVPTMWMMDDEGETRAVPRFPFSVLAEDKRLAAISRLKATLNDLSSM